MKRTLFDLLLKFLHFSNNEDNTANNDRLSKIRNIQQITCQRFQKILIPDRDVVIDETMVPWRGRLVFRQYLLAKSHKYGVKIYKVCTPEGYTYNLIIYAGKNRYGHSYNISMELMKGHLNEGGTPYVDNFYTSVHLVSTLLDKKTYICGTLQSNPKRIPKTVTSQKLKKKQIYVEENQEGTRVIK
ncbi:hypothetical protein NQ314_020253 [Rhamnusium bicolor]|uniref:PiggyBac transposable element-derived protein domain-containing protein n=1 Tax=Rhamnusium bicolor TaxID=1586634 RepID=A0AAV8WLT3_9CUCU|nr:hypothetical protein NQ314_020253 [Rhamnusium bicolor]